MARAFALVVLLTLCACYRPLSEMQNFVVFFPANDAVLTPEAHTLVTRMAIARHDMNPSRIIVEGRADGGTPHDAALAAERGRAVSRALVDAGVEAAMIVQQPSAPPEGVTGVAAHQVIVRFLP